MIVPYSIRHTKDKILVLIIGIGHGSARKHSILVKQVLMLINLLEADDIPERITEIVRSE